LQAGQFRSPMAHIILEPDGGDEPVPAQDLHMVEWPDLRHPIVDLAVRRTGRRRRAGQSLFPHQRRQDRSHPGLRAALGGLQWLRRSEPGAAVLAWLAASYRRCPADRSRLPATRMGKAASAEHDGDVTRLPAVRLDADEWPPSEGDRRLSAVDARQL